MDEREEGGADRLAAPGTKIPQWLEDAIRDVVREEIAAFQRRLPDLIAEANSLPMRR